MNQVMLIGAGRSDSLHHRSFCAQKDAMSAGTSVRDVLIVGGGVAGPSMGLALEQIGIRVRVFEAKPDEQDELGAWLNVAPNGLNILLSLGVLEGVQSAGFLSPGMTFYNAGGRAIGRVDSRDAVQKFGAGHLTIKRGRLHRALREAASSRGIAIEFGKKLDNVRMSRHSVTVDFADGTTATGDILIACDGIHSRTRRIVFPEAPQPSATGNVGFGGFVQAPGLVPPDGLMRMTFGHRGFFGHVAAPDGEVYWFSTVQQDDEALADRLAPTDVEACARVLQSVHGNDPWPIPEIVRAAHGGTGAYEIADMPSLATWSRERVVLVGDAAHATSPHAGQGASLAMEDSLVLARCLRHSASSAEAFVAYEDQRRDRVERLVATARRNGEQKKLSGLPRHVRDFMFPLFLKLAQRQSEEVYSYCVEWKAPSSLAPARAAA
jgi:2-polyprenyl-6-methoxyphenol hydroxylase-like FAD-dependent oxidoreductase